MFKYIVFLLLLYTASIQAMHHTLTMANIAVTKTITAVVGSTCHITDRMNAISEINDDKNTIIIVTVVCNGINGFTQYLMNVYDDIDGEIAVSTPIIVGAGDMSDFRVESINMTDNNIIVSGIQWTGSKTNHSINRRYILQDHIFIKKDK